MTGRARRDAVALAGAAVLVFQPGAPTALHAQGTRGWATTTVRLLELPVPVRATDATAETAGEILRTWTGTQDVSLTAWGLGVRGLSVSTLLRGRVDGGGDFTWPRSDDAFDAILLYAQFDQGDWRVRMGRQENASGLGFTAFDGASARFSLAGAGSGLAVEAFGGRSLARGLSEPRDEALRGLEDFIPDEDAWLVGASLEARLARATSADLRYQREIWRDRSGLISERASLDVRSGALAPVRVTGSLDWDFAFGRVGKAHATATWAPTLRSLLEFTARRYVPYFELSTVWGFFDPVPYHEGLVRVSLSPRDGLGVWASGSLRAYGESDSPVFLSALEDRGWRGEAGATWRPGGGVDVTSRYEIDWLPGAFLQGASATVAWQATPDLRLSGSATTFQRFEEFRLGDGRAVGVGAGASARTTDRTRLDGGVMYYRHTRADVDGLDPWNQSRAWLSLRVAVGDDPGLRGRVLGDGSTAGILGDAGWGHE